MPSEIHAEIPVGPGSCGGCRFIQISWFIFTKEGTSVAEMKKSYRTREKSDETVTQSAKT